MLRPTAPGSSKGPRWYKPGKQTDLPKGTCAEMKWALRASCGRKGGRVLEAAQGGTLGTRAAACAVELTMPWTLFTTSPRATTTGQRIPAIRCRYEMRRYEMRDEI